MGLGHIWRNLKSRGLKDVTNVKTVKSFLEWKDIQKEGLNLKADEIISFSQQIAVRASLCEECLKAGECVHCHCEIIGKISTPNASCSVGRWGPTLSPEEWKEEQQTGKHKIIVV